ncbi:MAG: sigma 54-interacting transcriptional regulator [Desulfovibrionaceae bacterium]|jgi:transcriptional regulator with PAS, ATPase and Fis domain|nr:sigma 54-interacting transcriptional regulator [Desulfovibrionaceae bacterium]
MASDIAVIAPDLELVAQFEELRQETILDFSVHKGLLEEAVTVGRELIDQGAKVLVSRDATANMLRAAFSTPVVDIPVTIHDVLPLIDQARNYSERIAVVGFGQPIKAARVVAPVLSVQLEIVQLKVPTELPEAVARVKAMGITAVVGSATVVAAAEKIGLRGFSIRMQKVVLRDVLEQAAKVLDVLRREHEWKLRQQASIDAAREGVIVLDAQGRLLHANQWMQMDPSLGGALFENDGADRTLRDPEILDAVRGCKGWRGMVSSGQAGIEFVCRVHPVVRDGKNFGAVLLLEHGGAKKQDLQHETFFGKGLVAEYQFKDIVHDGPAMRDLISRAQRYASVDSTVLILGECGTGKELIAQSLHNASRRRHGPFVAVNCSALPEQLLESELFGYVDGAFTGARKGGKKGILELAESGTLFLDEIGEMSLPLQVKLLRVLETRQIMRVGGDRIIPVNVRILCATNRNLPQMIDERRFREDLYFRINVLQLTLPPLRERGSCLDSLIGYYSREICFRLGLCPSAIAPDAWEVLREYSYPGNVRELKSILERLIVDHQGELIDARTVLENLEAAERPAERPRGQAPAPQHKRFLRREELRFIHKALDECGGNRAEAARRLGMSTTTLWRRLKDAQ